jgi:hypothetical protein
LSLPKEPPTLKDLKVAYPLLRDYTAASVFAIPSPPRLTPMRLLSKPLFALAVTVALTSTARAQAFKDLLVAVPEDANALVLIHAKNLRESVVAREFRAKTLRGSSQVDKHIVPREDIQRLVLAAELTPGLTPNWEVAIADVRDALSLELLAAQSAGQSETLGPFDALRLNTNAYLIKLAPKLYGVFTPATRQKAQRWAERATKSKQTTLSPYLAQIAEFPETAGTEIMLGLDVTGMLDVSHIRANLKRSETLKKRTSVNQEELANVLASIQGVALGVKATDQLNGKLRIDFATSPAIMKDFAKELMLEKLGDMGMMIEDFENWDVSQRGNTVYLSGQLSPTGLRRVLSLIDPPTLPAAAPVMSAMPSASEMDPMALPSQRYFGEIKALLTDMTARENAKYAKQAGWYDKYARKINQLSMVNVDPDLMDYGMSVTMAFSAMAYNLRNQAAEASQFSNNANTTYNVYGDNWYGYSYTWQTDPAQRPKAEKQAKMYGTMSYADTVRSVTNTTAEIRRRMVERYKMDF